MVFSGFPLFLSTSDLLVDDFSSLAIIHTCFLEKGFEWKKLWKR